MADDDLLSMRLGDAGTELRRKLVEAVMQGSKTGTSSLRDYYAPISDEPLPRVGQRRTLRGVDDEPVAMIEITEVRVIPIEGIDLAFAVSEGEGFGSVAEWRSAHEEFWADQVVSDGTLVVAQRFTVVQHV